MTTEPGVLSGEVTLTVTITGDSAADVLAIQQTILTVASRCSGASNAKASTTFKAPGLMGLPLGGIKVSSRRKDLLVRAGIVDRPTFLAADAEKIKKAIGWGGLKDARYGLHWDGQGEHLKGDDPARFPHLVDSLSISLEQYAWLRERGIETIAQLLDRRTADNVVQKFGNLDRLLARHAKSYDLDDYIT